MTPASLTDDDAEEDLDDLDPDDFEDEDDFEDDPEAGAGHGPIAGGLDALRGHVGLSPSRLPAARSSVRQARPANRAPIGPIAGTLDGLYDDLAIVGAILRLQDGAPPAFVAAYTEDAPGRLSVLSQTLGAGRYRYRPAGGRPAIDFQIGQAAPPPVYGGHPPAGTTPEPPRRGFRHPDVPEDALPILRSEIRGEFADEIERLKRENNRDRARQENRIADLESELAQARDARTRAEANLQDARESAHRAKDEARDALMQAHTERVERDRQLAVARQQHAEEVGRLERNHLKELERAKREAGEAKVEAKLLEMQRQHDLGVEPSKWEPVLDKVLGLLADAAPHLLAASQPGHFDQGQLGHPDAGYDDGQGYDGHDDGFEPHQGDGYAPAPEGPPYANPGPMQHAPAAVHAPPAPAPMPAMQAPDPAAVTTFLGNAAEAALRGALGQIDLSPEALAAHIEEGMNALRASGHDVGPDALLPIGRALLQRAVTDSVDPERVAGYLAAIAAPHAPRIRPVLALPAKSGLNVVLGFLGYEPPEGAAGYLHALYKHLKAAL